MSRISELAEELDLEFWLDRESKPFKLTRGASGMQINVRECPSCGDRRWRTYLNADTGRGNCFVCNQTFNKATFIHAALGEPAWRETGKHMEQVLREQGWRPKKLVSVAVEDGEIQLPTSFALPTPDGQNLIYLENRGIDADLARYFHLRFCEEGWWNFTKEDGSRGGQRFDMRVILPVYDLDGTLKTFQGRDVTGNAEVERYLFPKGLPGTGRYLYNGHNVGRAKQVAVGEGAFDVFSIKKALDEDVELRNVVAIGTFGKHLSYGSMDADDQLGRFIQLRREGLETVTIMWDGAKSALTAALDAAKLLKGIGLKVKIALLPRDKDPNEVLPVTVRKAFYAATPYDAKLDVMWRLRNPYA
jgi:DNA primase